MSLQAKPASSAAPCRPWLPPSALDPAEIDGALAQCIAAWSQNWFARGRLRLLSRFSPALTWKPQVNGKSWHVASQGAALGVADKAAAALVKSMIDADPGSASLTARDRALIERLLDACLGDLRGSLERLLGISGESSWQTAAQFPAEQGDWTCTLGFIDREPVIQLVVRHDLLIAFRKLRVRSPGRPAELQPMTCALERQPVTISARLGQCSMMLPDFAALAEGDVLILDRPLDGLIELAINGDVRSSGCALEQDDGRLFLKFSQSLSG